MKTYRLSLLAAGMLTLAAAVAATAAETSRLAGKWKIDIAGSTSIKPWEKADLDISVEGDAVRIVRHLQWGPDRKVDDITRVVADGKTVTANPVGHWLDTWYTNVYVGGDRQKQVTAEWLDGGRVLKLESRLTLESALGRSPRARCDEY
ncbi:MAG: hypothetical protein IPN11_08900, partial [Opitutaceae bacterium]|nr:hypothetical protein [Opitutaceae bacterium]